MSSIPSPSLIHDAIDILTNEQLSINEVENAYDILILASFNISNEISLITNTGFGEPYSHQNEKGFNLLHTKKEITSTSIINHTHKNILDSMDLILLSDLYKSLIITCQLLLEMNISNQSKQSSIENDTIYLNNDDIEIIKHTMKQSMILLKAISIMYQLTLGATKPTFKLEENWFLHLPQSNYDLIQVCFDGPEPIICLDELGDYDTTYGEDVALNDTKESNKIDINGCMNDNVVDDEIVLDMNPKQLEKEESELLHIAFPDNNRQSNNPMNGIDHKTTRMKPIIIKGWLIVQEQDAIHTSEPKYCQLYSNGTLIVNNHSTTIQDTTDTSSAFYLNESTVCKPIVQDKVFHFSLESHASSLNKKTKYCKILFHMFESSDDGGFQKGFLWISAINNVIMTSNVRRRVQDEIFSEWNM